MELTVDKIAGASKSIDYCATEVSEIDGETVPSNVIIKFLLGEIERIEKQWISVEDRLPEVGESVIAYGLYDGEINGVGSMMVDAGVWTGNHVEMEADAYSATLINITHWQPLPPPPE